MGKKTNKSKTPRHSGFEVPVSGYTYPAGTVFIKHTDGSVTPVLPKKKRNDREAQEQEQSEEKPTA